MSLVTLTSNISPEQQKAQDIAKSIPLTFQRLFREWDNGVKAIWKDSNPQSVIDELHKILQSQNPLHTVSEAFLLSEQTVVFLEQQKPGCTTETISLIKPFTVNLDGSIKIN